MGARRRGCRKAIDVRDLSRWPSRRKADVSAFHPRHGSIAIVSSLQEFPAVRRGRLDETILRLSMLIRGRERAGQHKNSMLIGSLSQISLVARFHREPDDGGNHDGGHLGQMLRKVCS